MPAWVDRAAYPLMGGEPDALVADDHDGVECDQSEARVTRRPGRVACTNSPWYRRVCSPATVPHA